MSASGLNEHLNYWRDSIKIAGYRKALAEVVSPGDHVLDLGSGTGLLGLLAAQAGAAKVWCFDSGEILGVARDLAVAHNLADRMEFVKGLTTDVDLPQVDVIVCDQIGGLAFDAGVLEYFADASERSLRPGGVLVPRSFDLFLVPVEAPSTFADIDAWDCVDGFDLSLVRERAVNTEHRVGPSDLRLLSDGEQVASIDSNDPGRIAATCTTTATDDGTIHGLSGWFDAHMSTSVTLSNNPRRSDRMNRWLNFYPAAEPITVSAGDTITMAIDIRPKGRLVVWSLAVNDGPTQKMSTFNGTFIFDQAKTFGADGDIDDTKAELAQKMIENLRTGATRSELIAMARQHRDLFVSNDAAVTFARQVHGLLA